MRSRPGYERVFHEGRRIGRGQRAKKGTRYSTWQRKKRSRADKVNLRARASAKARYHAEGKRLLKYSVRLLRQYQRVVGVRHAALSRRVDLLCAKVSIRP